MRMSGSAVVLAALLGPWAAPAAGPPAVDGVWQQRGYGRLLVIDGQTVRTYDINAVECHASEETTLADMGEVVRADGRRLELRYGVNRYAFERRNALPNGCRAETPDSTPLQNFDSLWHTMREHYAFFDERGIDWDAVRARYRPRIRDDMGDAELFRLLHEMLAQIGDGHVRIEPPDELRATLDADAAKPAPEAGPSRFELGQQAKEAIVRRYVNAPRQYNAGAVRWGVIDGNVGYVQINHMLMLADYGVDPSLGMRAFFDAYFEAAEGRPYQYRDEVLAARALTARIVGELKGTRAVILDLRFNGGGKDGAALEFLRPFVREPVAAFTKKAREGEGFGARQPVVLEPVSPRHGGRLFVLTSAQTASAAEILVLASRRIPGSVRVGDTTEGIFSDTLDKTLPNGWAYTLSNEVYETPAGEVFEGVGIPPDIRIRWPREPSALYRTLRDDANAPERGDAAIEAVLALLRQPEDARGGAASGRRTRPLEWPPDMQRAARWP